jgi:hypothetical protein
MTQSSTSAQVRDTLTPHIVSPLPEEFLLTTGTKPEEPAVGMFVNMDGDVTRGTIQFEQYPKQMIVQGKWVIAVIPGAGLEVQRWDVQNISKLPETDRKGRIQLEGDIHLKEVLILDGTVVVEAGKMLQLAHLPLKPTVDRTAMDHKRSQEELVVARRISTVESKIVVFSGKKLWTLISCPLSVRLNSRLPDFSDENFDGIVARIKHVLHVLEEVQSIEPTTETGFHETSFVRQKCGLLVLGELLRITQRQTADLSAREILIVEAALMESDPRFIVALFGNAFEEDVVEGDGGVWVYGGIREVFGTLKASSEVGQTFTREVLLLLKRYLGAWRSKKGFGSVAHGKDIFHTVDASLLRVLLMLDSPEYLVEKGKTVVPEGDIRAELYAFIDSGVENFNGAVHVLKFFGRLYVLSILYSRAKKYRDVLNTWRQILEEGDSSKEFLDGEEKIKNYLIKLKDPGLVEEFGCWLAARNSKLGVEVFADETARVKFHPPRVFDMLRRNAPGAIRSYVEYLVDEKKACPVLFNSM